jgi:cold-inducible RNA-binding protein
MNNKLFVGGLPYTTTSDEMREFFEVIGEVLSADVIFDKFTNRSKGFGFVEMATPELAQKAIAELDGKELGGRSIAVNEAKPKEPRENRGGFGGDRGGNGGGSFRRDDRAPRGGSFGGGRSF